mmetsp:Transcript_6053/g.24046  ORF Transcript_6053/g.24046 Transcript_6053/m.24046 type:complete len:891 (+) Transcript_6053:727-3399(+)
MRANAECVGVVPAACLDLVNQRVAHILVLVAVAFELVAPRVDHIALVVRVVRAIVGGLIAVPPVLVALLVGPLVWLPVIGPGGVVVRVVVVVRGVVAAVGSVVVPVVGVGVPGHPVLVQRPDHAVAVGVHEPELVEGNLKVGTLDVARHSGAALGHGEDDVAVVLVPWQRHKHRHRGLAVPHAVEANAELCGRLGERAALRGRALDPGVARGLVRDHERGAEVHGLVAIVLQVEVHRLRAGVHHLATAWADRLLVARPQARRLAVLDDVRLALGGADRQPLDDLAREGLEALVRRAGLGELEVDPAAAGTQRHGDGDDRDAFGQAVEIHRHLQRLVELELAARRLAAVQVARLAHGGLGDARVEGDHLRDAHRDGLGVGPLGAAEVEREAVLVLGDLVATRIAVLDAAGGQELGQHQTIVDHVLCAIARGRAPHVEARAGVRDDVLELVGHLRVVTLLAAELGGVDGRALLEHREAHGSALATVHGHGHHDQSGAAVAHAVEGHREALGLVAAVGVERAGKRAGADQLGDAHLLVEGHHLGVADLQGAAARTQERIHREGARGDHRRAGGVAVGAADHLAERLARGVVLLEGARRGDVALHQLGLHRRGRHAQRVGRGQAAEAALAQLERRSARGLQDVVHRRRVAGRQLARHEVILHVAVAHDNGVSLGARGDVQRHRRLGPRVGILRGAVLFDQRLVGVAHLDDGELDLAGGRVERDGHRHLGRARLEAAELELHLGLFGGDLGDVLVDARGRHLGVLHEDDGGIDGHGFGVLARHEGREGERLAASADHVAPRCPGVAARRLGERRHGEAVLHHGERVVGVGRLDRQTGHARLGAHGALDGGLVRVVDGALLHEREGDGALRARHGNAHADGRLARAAAVVGDGQRE